MTSIPAPTNDLQENSSASSSPAEQMQVTDPRQDNQEDQPKQNKFKYPEFAGPAGERYLLSLAEQFSPFALWRTWHAAVSYQAPGNTCHVGVSRLVERKRPQQGGIGVGVRERKVYLDLEALEERGWLTQERVRLSYINEDGNTVYYAATAKDFSGFYDTAYDYHLWINSPEYIAPERENVPLILAEPGLAHRLIRFENYRRLLVHQKPGPKSSQKPDFYTCQLEALAAQAEQSERASTSVQEVNIQLNPSSNGHSPYRIIGDSVKNDRDIHSSYSTSEGDGLAVAAIRNEYPPNIGGTQPNGAASSKLNSPSSPQEERRGAARAETALGYTEIELRQDTAKRGAAAIGISADQHRKLNGGLDQTEEAERRQREREAEVEPARPGREVPAPVIAEVEQFARQYDDPNLIPSVLTRARKTYAVAEEALDYFNINLYWQNFDAAKGAAVKYAYKRRNSKGKRTCVPYFFTCLENEFNFSLEELIYLREDDPLYTDYGLVNVINDLRGTYKRLQRNQETDLEYREWLISLLDQLEHRKEPKERSNPTARDY